MPRPGWLDLLAAEIAMAPAFRRALDEQLRGRARAASGIELADGNYALLPPDGGFVVRFQSLGAATIGTIDGFLVDPSAFGHPVTLGWRNDVRPVGPDEDPAGCAFFWLAFPDATLAAGSRIDTNALAASVAAPFPIDWDVHHASSVWLQWRGRHEFDEAALAALTTALADSVRNWNARDAGKIHFLAPPERCRDGGVAYYLDLGSAGLACIPALVDAVGASPAASAIVCATIGARRF
jgi:hypothetical protein